MRYFWLVNLADDEEAEMIKGELRMLLDVSSKLEYMENAGRIADDEIAFLKKQHQSEIADIEKRLHKMIKKSPDHGMSIIRQTILKHALWLERFWLKELFAYGEIPEETFKKFMRKIENQSYRISQWKSQLRAPKEASEKIWPEYLSDLLWKIFPNNSRPLHVQEYLKARARNIIASRVLRDLDELNRIDFLKASWVLEDTKQLYTNFENQATTLRLELFEKYRKELLPIDSHLASKALAQVKMKVLTGLVEKGTLSSKIAGTLKERIDGQLFQ